MPERRKNKRPVIKHEVGGVYQDPVPVHRGQRVPVEDLTEVVDVNLEIPPPEETNGAHE